MNKKTLASGTGVGDTGDREDEDGICEAPASSSSLYDTTNIYRPSLRVCISNNMGDGMSERSKAQK